MSISAVKLNENVDPCDTSSSKVTPKEIARVIALALFAIFRNVFVYQSRAHGLFQMAACCNLSSAKAANTQSTFCLRQLYNMVLGTDKRMKCGLGLSTRQKIG